MFFPHTIGNWARALLFLLFLCTTLWLPDTEAQQTGPGEVIRKFDAALLEAMKRSGELGYSGRYQLLNPVMRDAFAFRFMASKVAGRYWKTMSTEEKDLFLKTYIEWSVATYAGRFNEYSGERFEIAQEQKPDQGRATVISRLVQQSGKTVEFHYLLSRIEGRWRIIDIRIEGVSQLALTRSQFTGTMKKNGFNGLITMLEEKIRGYSGKK